MREQQGIFMEKQGNKAGLIEAKASQFVFTACPLLSCRCLTLQLSMRPSASCPACPSPTRCIRTSQTPRLSTTPVTSGTTSCKGTRTGTPLRLLPSAERKSSSFSPSMFTPTFPQQRHSLLLGSETFVLGPVLLPKGTLTCRLRCGESNPRPLSCSCFTCFLSAGSLAVMTERRFSRRLRDTRW